MNEMATLGRVNVPIGKIVRDNLTLTVELRASGVRLFKFRAWLGAQIMKLAALVIGCRIEIKGDK
jgi:hypothetical protein